MTNRTPAASVGRRGPKLDVGQLMVRSLAANDDTMLQLGDVRVTLIDYAPEAFLLA